MTKIYTKTGDQGKTSLLAGERVYKDCITLQTVGEVDDLNSKLGEVVANLWEDEPAGFLKKIQQDLFKVGAELAALQTAVEAKIKKVGEEEVSELEQMIDSYSEQLPPLTNFILPGGNLAAANLHSARVSCRRAERALVSLGKDKEIRADLYKYLNRLSDYLFVTARWVNFNNGVEEFKV